MYTQLLNRPNKNTNCEETDKAADLEKFMISTERLKIGIN